ncbi:MAG: S9 family peptidase [Acidobacteriota bacterium]
MNFLTVFGMAIALAWAAEEKPPTAAKKEHVEVRHGATINDPYFWLREKTSPEVISYLTAENAYTARMTAGQEKFAGKLYEEMLGRIKQTDLGVPFRRGSYFYYSRTEEGKQYPIQCRKKGSLEAPEEVLLDLNEIGKGQKFASVTAMSLSSDAMMLAYGTDFIGYRQFKLNVKDLRTGKLLPDSAERVTATAWAEGGRTVFYVTEDDVTKRSNQLWRLELGAKPELIYEEKDELYNITVEKTRDEKYLMLLIASTDTSEVMFLDANKPRSAFRSLAGRTKGHRYVADHREGLFYLLTNKGAKNFRIVTVPVSDPAEKHWKEFLAHNPDVLVQNIALYRGFAAVVEKTMALTRIRVFDFSAGKWKSIAFPEPVYAVFPEMTPDYESPTMRYSYQSLVSPRSIYDYTVTTGESQLLKRQEVLGGFDPAHYVSERLWATARDGVKVPLSLVYKRGLVRDGKAPLLMMGYGSYGFGMPPAFSSSRLSLLDRGVTYVIAHIRGGDEMGEKWHEDGMLMKKKNTFYDFIDSAEYLIREKWTSKDRLMIEGGSAGGLLMGAVVNLRPDLFRAVHAAVPFVDVMNTMMDATLPLTVGEYLEWGNPNEKQAHDYMKSYSPYDNLEKRAYPAILVTTSLHDSQVGYWEAAKYVARLRTLKTDSNDLLLKTKLEPAGHGGASGRYDQIKDLSFIYAWFLTQAGIEK